MKLVTEDREVGRFGTGQEQEFTIRGSAKAFKILSDSLYSNKPLAVIRELSCNARDSHVQAGKHDVPFEVHLPNRLEPWFAVTDYGVGLCHDDVMNLYSTYFDSTKTDSNDVTGCLGLGSKSPFAYVDAFTVEARWNGKLTLYSCFYNEKGVPTITVLGEPMDTDQPNGLTVKMPVKDGDFSDFAQNAMKALNRFNPAPIVTGNTSYKLETVEYTVEGTGWKMIKNERSYGYGDRVNAIQGNVTYPISGDSLNRLNSNQRAVMSLPIDLFFDIGKLDVAASRESLSYDTSTVTNIMEMLDVVIEELPSLYQDKFDECTTLWEARVLFKDIVRGLPTGIQRILSDKDVGLKWHKQPLDENFSLKKEEFEPEIMYFERGTRSNRGQHFDTHYSGEYRFDPDANVAFFYDDVGHGSHSRITYYLENNSDAKRRNYLVKTTTKKALKKFSKAVGNVTVRPVSILPKRPKTQRSVARITSKVLEYMGHASDRRDSWNPTEIDLKKGNGKIFVTINRFKVFDGTREVHDFSTLVDLVEDNKILTLTGKTIYGIRAGDVAKMSADSGWTNLFDMIRASLDAIVAKENIASVLVDHSAFQKFTCKFDSYMEDFQKETFEADSPIAAFLTAYKYMAARKSDRAAAIQRVASKMEFAIKKATATHDLDTAWKKVEERYPLLTMLDDYKIRGGYYSSSSRKENWSRVIAYMKTVDAVEAITATKLMDLARTAKAKS